MKTSIIMCLLSIGCAFTPPTVPNNEDYCGQVGTLSVYVSRHNGFVSCIEAMACTRDAMDVFDHTVGILNEHWTVEYAAGYLDYNDRAVTYPEQHIIKVQERMPTSVFHELLHAYMFENHTLGNQHKKICSTHSWWKAEADFSQWPTYCYSVGGVK